MLSIRTHVNVGEFVKKKWQIGSRIRYLANNRAEGETSREDLQPVPRVPP